MITKLEKKLKITYGFEIEGLLRKKEFDGFLGMNNKDDGFQFEYTDDGSVSFDGGEYDDLPFERADWREFKLGVFKSKKEMLRFLAMFSEDDNYCHNSTCGLHLHIKIGNRLYKSMFNDWEFMVKLHKFFKSKKLLCECQLKRVGNTYCKGYPTDLSHFLSEWRRQEKYRIIRNHPQGTFEFRIFSACEHKVENVKNFLDFFFSEITKIPLQKNIILKLDNDYVRDTIRL